MNVVLKKELTYIKNIVLFTLGGLSVHVLVYTIFHFGYSQTPKVDNKS